MKKLLLITLLFLSLSSYGQEPKDDIVHYLGSGGLTALTYSIPRNTLGLPWYLAVPISFLLNEGVGQLVEHSQGNHYSQKDLRINRYGTGTGILTFELSKQVNKVKDLEERLVNINIQLTNQYKPISFKNNSIELNGKKILR